MPAPEAKRDARAMFNRISGVYDFLNHLLSFNLDRSWRRKLAKRALHAESMGSDAEEERSDGRGLTPNEVLVLDVCCGTGDSALALAREMCNNGLVVGLDFAEKMLRRMRKKIARRNAAARVAACMGDAMRLPFRDSVFDAVTSGFGIRNLPERAPALREMLRVTRPGGRIAIMEFVRPAEGAISRGTMFYMRRILPIIGRIFSGDEFNAYSYLPDSIMKFPTAEEFRREMLDAGCAEAAYELNVPGPVTFFTGTK
jgi:demethylmenaquinone methyltransferase/2-methoxy-6-polyprenyl-1,4-benzoquinol methylase